MKKFIKYLFLTVLASVMIYSCKLKTDDAGVVDPIIEEGSITLTGLVLSNYSGSAIVNALVQVYKDTLLANATTNTNGEFSIQVTVTEDSELTVVVIKENFVTDTTNVFGVMDESIQVPEIRMIPSTSSTVTFTGLVINNSTGIAIANALIKVFNDYISANALTENNGEFSLTMTIYEEGELYISAFKEGYISDTTETFALENGNITIPTFRLEPTAAIEEGSGDAASIFLLSVSENTLGIKESGNTETATAVFQVQDSSGRPIDLNHSVEVQLSIAAGPGGGEYLFPASVSTNEDGKASFTINAGTKAGVLQIVAQIDMPTLTLRSLPVFFTIYGGFPVQSKFEVACDNLNYPYWGIIGKEITFTAYMGDKYTNPVRPETAVYFNVFEGDGTIGTFSSSDLMGRAASTYLTYGFPIHSTLGPGFFEIQASTIDENSQTINTNTVRLLSGPSIIYDVAPAAFAIANGGNQVFTFKVSDQNGNPLSAGTSINVTVQGGNLKSSMEEAIIFEDFMANGPGLTEFSVTIYDDNTDIDELKNASMKISVTSPNGNTSYTVFGTTN